MSQWVVITQFVHEFLLLVFQYWIMPYSHSLPVRWLTQSALGTVAGGVCFMWGSPPSRSLVFLHYMHSFPCVHSWLAELRSDTLCKLIATTNYRASIASIPTMASVQMMLRTMIIGGARSTKHATYLRWENASSHHQKSSQRYRLSSLLWMRRAIIKQFLGHW